MSTTTLPKYAVHPISSVPMIVIADVSHTLNRLTHLSKTKRMSDVRLDAVVDLLLQLADRPNEWYPEFGGIIMHPDLATRPISLKDVMHIAHTFGNKAHGRKKVPVDAFIEVIIMLTDQPTPEPQFRTVSEPERSLPLPAGMIIIEQDHDDHMHTLIGFMRESAQGNYVAFWAYVSESDLWAGQQGGNANLCITTYDPSTIRVARDQSAAGLPEELALASHPRFGTVLVTRATNDIGDHLVLTTFKGNAAQTYAKPGEFLFLS